MLRREDYTGAFAQLNRAVGLGGDVGAIAAKLSDAGASLASRNRPRDAEPLIRRAIELDPMLVQARRNLVLVLEDQGRMVDARTALQQAVQATGQRREYSDIVREIGLSVAAVPDRSR
jgi:Flp pilus assembly protein TadD